MYLVDSDASARSEMLLALAAEGFHARSWSTAEAFLAEYDPGEPACLVSEVTLPGIDGLLLQNFLARSDPSLPVIFITRGDHVSTAVQAMRAGALARLPAKRAWHQPCSAAPSGRAHAGGRIGGAPQALDEVM